MKDLWKVKGFGLLSEQEAERMDPFKHPGIKYSDVRKIKVPDQALVDEYTEKMKIIKGRLAEKGIHDPSIFIREARKVKKEFYKELIKKYPKEKKSIEQLQKEQEKFLNLKLRYRELLQIATRRHLTNKEVKEIENMSKKFKRGYSKW